MELNNGIQRSPFYTATLPNTPTSTNEFGDIKVVQHSTCVTDQGNLSCPPPTQTSNSKYTWNKSAGDVGPVKYIGNVNDGFADVFVRDKLARYKTEDELATLSDEFLAETHTFAKSTQTARDKSLSIYKERKALREKCACFDFNNTYLDTIPEETVKEMAVADIGVPKRFATIIEKARKQATARVWPDMSGNNDIVLTQERLLRVTDMFCVESQAEATERRLQVKQVSDNLLIEENIPELSNESVKNRFFLRVFRSLKNYVCW